MRATRAYIAGFGTAGSLLAGAAVLFVLASAVVSFRGFPTLGGQHQPVAVVPARAAAGSPEIAHVKAAVAAQALRFRSPARPAAAPHLAAAATGARPDHLRALQRPTPSQPVTPPPPHRGPHRQAPAPPVTGSAPEGPTASACPAGLGCTVSNLGSALGGVTSSTTSGLGDATGALGQTLGQTVAGATGSLGRTLGALSPGLGAAVQQTGAGLGAILASATGSTGLGAILANAGQSLGPAVTNLGALLGGVLQPGSQNGPLSGVTGPSGS